MEYEVDLRPMAIGNLIAKQGSPPVIEQVIDAARQDVMRQLPDATSVEVIGTLGSFTFEDGSQTPILEMKARIVTPGQPVTTRFVDPSEVMT